MNVLVWFKRDLRIADHPALTLAAETGAVLPLYIVEPDLWAQPDASARQWAFTAECLADLRDDLARIGAPLIVRTGDAVDILARLTRQYRIRRIISHHGTGNGWSRARDLRVADWARGVGIEWQQVGLAPDASAGTADPVPAVAAITAISGVEPGIIPTARALRLPEDRCPHRQPGGRAQGLLLLDSFLAARSETYLRAASSPLTAERNCSRLSPHLALGTLSVREVAQATTALDVTGYGRQWRGSLTAFQSRLALRTQVMQQPPAERDCLPPLPETPHPHPPDAIRLAAWSSGETGLPFVDASMRYLAATGWINAPMRAMLACVATAHLGLDWRAAGAALARRFTDYDPVIHWPQMQIHAGLAGGRARIGNPAKLGQNHDPAGIFIRRWVPELASLDAALIHTPWTSAAGRALPYPEPLVDPAAAAKAARDGLRGTHDTMQRRIAIRPFRQAAAQMTLDL